MLFADVQAAADRIGGVRLRFARRRQRRTVLHLWSPEPRSLGLRVDASRPRGDIGFFVTLILYGCSILYGLGLLLSYRWGFDIMGSGNPMAALSPAPLAKLLFGASGAAPVFQYGMWWTVLSAGWLHGGVLHLLFNMMAVRNLAPPTADIYGAPRMIIIYSMGSVGGFLLSSFAGLFNIPLFGAYLTLGASAPLFGSARGGDVRRPPVGQQRRARRSEGVRAGVLCLRPDHARYRQRGACRRIHRGYFAGMVLDPLKPQSLWHLVGALACLVLTALAIIASIVTVWPAIPGSASNSTQEVRRPGESA